MFQTNVQPLNALEAVCDVQFNVLIKSNVTLTNGTHTVMFTAVPTSLNYDDAIAGVLQGLKFSCSAASVQHEIYSLKAGGGIEKIGYSITRHLK